MAEGEVMEQVPAVCRTCRFGHGDDRACVLLERGDQATLFDEGPCHLGEVVRRETRRLIHRRYPFARSLEEDLGSDVLLRVLEAGNLLASDRIRHLQILERRLREVVRTAVIDSLRQHRLVTRVRCGACVHFEKEIPPPGCELQFLPDLGTEVRPNPWYGQKVERTTDPRSLLPRCEAFTWRRPDTHDIFAEEIPGVDPEGSPRERVLALLVNALDRLARRDQNGMRVASTMFWHYLRGRSVGELASESAVSEKTIKRLLAEGRERLLEILRDEMGVEDVGEIL